MKSSCSPSAPTLLCGRSNGVGFGPIMMDE
jgi:hypothetical protein